jgi:hypothetical protein
MYIVQIVPENNMAMNYELVLSIWTRNVRFLESLSLFFISPRVLQGARGGTLEMYDRDYRLMSPVNKLEVHEAGTHVLIR